MDRDTRFSVFSAVGYREHWSPTTHTSIGSDDVESCDGVVPPDTCSCDPPNLCMRSRQRLVLVVAQHAALPLLAIIGTLVAIVMWRRRSRAASG